MKLHFSEIIHPHLAHLTEYDWNVVCFIIDKADSRLKKTELDLTMKSTHFASYEGLTSKCDMCVYQCNTGCKKSTMKYVKMLIWIIFMLR